MNSHFWKNCSAQEERAFLLDLNLLRQYGDAWSDKEKIALLYTVSRTINQHYLTVKIPKRTGGLRTLHAPDPLLKMIQKNILSLLETRTLSAFATAYRKGGSILANATPHVGKKQLLQLDLLDFFDSLSFPMVMAAAFPKTVFPDNTRMLLTNLCCLNDALPQGAPTSALISNLIMRPFDDYIGEWCKERQIAYSRYSDDLTFSTNEGDLTLVKRKVEHFLEAMQLNLHPAKTKYTDQSMRQCVTGVVVNQHPQVPRRYRSMLRQEIYYLEKFGLTGHLACLKEKGEVAADLSEKQYLRKLIGKVQFVCAICPESAGFQDAYWRLQKLAISFEE
ncbi:reverse transcriptase family protein [Listeria costaricensis]|uniref:reverse transcriptase family protein n=1 Tax=Listeria costaricensis TaxID=2026604 RepID=UPI000C0731C5|nr:reverse transcriptase family protein [Listeria costaricensis]